MFKNKVVHDSLLFMLKNSVRDNRFVQVSKVYGIDLISKAIVAPQTKSALKDLVVETFTKDPRIV